MDSPQSQSSDLSPQSETAMDCDTKPMDVNLDSVVDKVSTNISEIAMKSAESLIEFRQPTLPIKFKKPSAKRNNTSEKTGDSIPPTSLNAKSSKSTANMEEMDMRNNANGTKSTDYSPKIDLKATASLVPGIKIFPVPYKEPSWSSVPPLPYSIEVLKGGVVIDTVEFNKPFLVFGRLAQCDVMLEHPSISRFHCVVQYRSLATDAAPAGVYVYDLSSTHGSYQNKNRLQPKVYNRLRVGHMLKFGGSSRNFVLLGPSEDAEEESPLSVKELQELARKKQEEKLAKELEKKQEAERKEQQRLKEEEEKGVDWGMGEDAVESDDDNCDGPNPFSALVRDELTLADPKKSLRGWYEREGYDLPEYDVTEITSGHFKCVVRLPVLGLGGEPLIATADHRGKKKDTVVQAALEACRLLDRHGMLRQATHVSHERAEVVTHDSDDEDEFLDRTGDVARKRDMRGARATKREVTYTYTQLSAQHGEVLAELQEQCSRLLEVQKLKEAKDAAANREEGDDLDAFMKNINKQIPDKHKTLTWKLRCIELRKEEARMRRLVNIARPPTVTELQPPQLPDGLILPGSQVKKTTLPPRPASNVAPTSNAKKGPLSSGVHSVFLEEDETPKLKLPKLDSSDDNVPKPIPYDKRVYRNQAGTTNRLAAKYLLWDDPDSKAKTNGASNQNIVQTVEIANETKKDDSNFRTVPVSNDTDSIGSSTSSSSIDNNKDNKVVSSLVGNSNSTVETESTECINLIEAAAGGDDEETSLSKLPSDSSPAAVGSDANSNSEHINNPPSSPPADSQSNSDPVTTTKAVISDMNEDFAAPRGGGGGKKRPRGPSVPSQLDLVRAAAQRSIGGGDSSKGERSKKRVKGPSTTGYNFEFDDPRAEEEWLPPSGQSGDGRTTLNDKLGY